MSLKPGTKRCSKCKDVKDVEEFYPARTATTNAKLQSRCKSCNYKQSHDYSKSAVGKQLRRHRGYSTKLKAIAVMGGACRCCGIELFGDFHEFAQFDHIMPIAHLRRNRSDRREDTTTFLRKIISGEEKNAQLLCASCHVSKTMDERKRQRLGLDLPGHCVHRREHEEAK